MKLDQFDFRQFNGHFYQGEPDQLAIDCFGHKAAQLRDTANGAFVYLNPQRRTELHAHQYPKGFDLVTWLHAHTEVQLLVTEEPVVALKNDLPQFIVPDAWAFYREAAAYARHHYTGNVITITGSVGKSTTQLMTVQLLQALKRRVLTNVANDNVRHVVVPLLTRVLQTPDDLVAELSINALNNRDKKGGPTSRLFEATTAVITQIGGAHLAELDGVADPLLFLANRKARIFERLAPDAQVVLNLDMPARIFKHVAAIARQKTTTIRTYSLHNSAADAYLLKQEAFRDHTQVTLRVLGETVTANLSLPGDGTIMDLLGACLIVKGEGLALPDMSQLFMNFTVLNSELRFQQVQMPHGAITVVDDTHGSTLHSVENVLSVFRERGPFYHGQRVLIMETGEDLGDHAKDYNLAFAPQIRASHVDTFIGYRDAAIQPLVTALADQLHTTFVAKLPDVKTLVQGLPADSLVIIKSSDGRKYGSDLWTLPDKLQHAII